MIESIEDFYLKYPQFCSINKEKYSFEGNFMFHNSPCTIEIHLPNFPQLRNFKCILKNTLTTVDITNNKLINQNWNIDEFLNYVPEIWKNENPNLNFQNELNYGKETLNILNQIIACKNEVSNVKMYVNDSLDSIKFDNFNGYDGHYLELKIENFNIEVKDHSLPNFNENWNTNDNGESFNNNLFSSPSTVIGYLKQFFKLLESFELFYKYINTLDDLCWIVEPATITLKYNWRMFKLIDNVYIKVILNPLCPNSININLYGPTLEVEKYREMYRQNINKWDCELDVYNNLLKIFDLMLFPSRDTTMYMETDEDLNCKICLSYLDDDGHIPICSCDNSKCYLVYHVQCLKTWFANSVEGRQFLNVTIGVCPFCKEKLSTSFKSLLDD